MFEGLSRGNAHIEGTNLAFVAGGSGSPTLLLHGFPQNLAMWARVAPIMSRHCTIVCADLRGYGDSSKPKGLPDSSNYTFRAMADDQVALMHKLGFDRFDVIGHDRGGRVGHRMALDHPESVNRFAALDIVPTYTMLMDTNRHVAAAYWHWYFLSQPAPFPERVIATDPDLFYEQCLVGWGATKLQDFDAEMLAEYRRAWRDPAMIHGSCSDYRAASSIDLTHDTADINRKVQCPTLVLYGAVGEMAKLFDIPAEWRKRCSDVVDASLPGAHFFVDQFPVETADILLEFIARKQS